VIVIYRKESIFRIGGWNERFIGWGGEDNYQEFKTKNLISWVENKCRCYHLWHTRPSPDNKWYPKTMELLNKLMSMSVDDTIKLINNDLLRIGMKNKYA
jgi:predicted glycosyltransferase involved in capsule biosynthesis